jgi:hypothetical protein
MITVYPGGISADRGREAHPGFTRETETTLEGLTDPQPSHPAGVRNPSRRACPRVRASHDPGLSAPIPPGCPHNGSMGPGWRRPRHPSQSHSHGDEDIASPFQFQDPGGDVPVTPPRAIPTAMRTSPPRSSFRPGVATSPSPLPEPFPKGRSQSPSHRTPPKLRTWPKRPSRAHCTHVRGVVRRRLRVPLPRKTRRT